MARLRERLDELSARLGDTEWLDGAFSAGDLLMVQVLRNVSRSGDPRGIPEPRRLCRARRGAARFRPRARGAAGRARPASRPADWPY